LYFNPKNPSKKGVRKTKKVSKKIKKNVFEKKKQKFSFKGEMFFSFFQKKRVSKSVFENGHFWLCPQIIITLRTFSPSPHGTT